MRTHPREPLFLGIDGGGTRCRARLCDAAGKRLGDGMAGSANTRLGLARVFTEIQDACRQALAAAGLDGADIARLHAGLGLAGVGLQSERDKLLAYPHPFKSIVLETDAYIACLGAHAGRDGAILILGTGSCGCAITQGESFTIGGWGFQLSDQGSGAALGHEALRRALWAHEGVTRATRLSRALMAKFHHSPEAAVLWADQAAPRDFAALAPLVFEHAAAGDELAQELVAASAAAAARLIRALLARGAPGLALLGGLAPALQTYLPNDLHAALREPAGDALDGALLMARAQYRRDTPGS